MDDSRTGRVSLNGKELASGLLLIGLAGFFLVNAVLTLPTGTTFRMGPGYFPIALSVVLGLLGTVVAARSWGRTGEGIGQVPWRGIVLITLATVSFGLVIPRLGLAPALAISVLLAAFSTRRMTLSLAVAIAAVLIIFSVAVFKYGLGLPVTIVGPS